MVKLKSVLNLINLSSLVRVKLRSYNYLAVFVQPCLLARGPRLISTSHCRTQSCFRGASRHPSAHPLGPSVPHVSHQEPQQLGVVLVAVADAVLIALPLVFLHHLGKHNNAFITGKYRRGEQEQSIQCFFTGL